MTARYPAPSNSPSAPARRNGGRLTPESVAGLLRNRWPACSGIGGRHGPDFARQDAEGNVGADLGVGLMVDGAQFDECFDDAEGVLDHFLLGLLNTEWKRNRMSRAQVDA